MSQTPGPCSMQTLLSPRALSCLSSLSTHRQHHHQHGARCQEAPSQPSGQRGARDEGQAEGVTLTKTMAAWCRGMWGESGDRNSSHLWQSEVLSRGGGGSDTRRSENKNAAQSDNSINIPLNSNQRINYKQIPLFSLCQHIVRCRLCN